MGQVLVGKSTIPDNKLYLKIVYWWACISPTRDIFSQCKPFIIIFSLDYNQEPSKSPEEIHRLADHCNEKKTSAKTVGDLSSELFFSVFVKVKIVALCNTSPLFKKR